MELLNVLPQTSSLLPHGYCYLWRPGLLGLHAVSDSIITLSYYSIPLGLVYLVRKRQDLPFNWIFWLFALFIAGCGTTHLMDIWTLWHPSYWLAGGVKAVTAAASVGTAVALVPLLPRIVALPTPAQLEQANRELAALNQQLREANRLRSVFVANMSHELRTPLNGIIGFAELMHDGKVGPVSADQKEYLADVLASSQHLLRLIDDVLDLSKVESGKMEFHPEPVNLGPLVREVRDILRTLAATKRIAVDDAIAPEAAAIHTDPGKLKQVLYNFLSNALKFTPEDGQVTIRVRSEGPDDIRLEVADTGIGIRAEDMGRLFVEFEQLNAGAAKQHPGTGLGLALTRRIVEAQGGRVGVRSEPGKGSVFFAILPRIGHHIPGPRPELPSRDGRLSAPTILVIDDEPRDREWLAGTIAASGYTVETAPTGAEGVDRCLAREFDAIILDLLLPDMHGQDVLRRIRAEGRNRTTPVIVVSVVLDKVAAGVHVHDILQKPVAPADLLRALQQAELAAATAGPVLVVDDDRRALRLAETTLHELGYRAVCRSDGEGALEAVDRETPSAIILDLLMPGMDGFEFLTRLRQRTRGRRVPVIVWTNKDITPADREGLRTAAHVVRKGGGMAALMDEVQARVPLPQGSGRVREDADER